MTNKNDMFTNFIDVSATLAAESISAAKTLGFAYICTKIAKHSSPIIGFASLVGMEIIWCKGGKFLIKKFVDKKPMKNDIYRYQD